MNIPTAIEELEKDIADFGGRGISPICQAEKLGIEALKAFQLIRNQQAGLLDWILPGETGERRTK